MRLCVGQQVRSERNRFERDVLKMITFVSVTSGCRLQTRCYVSYQDTFAWLVAAGTVRKVMTVEIVLTKIFTLACPQLESLTDKGLSIGRLPVEIIFLVSSVIRTRNLALFIRMIQNLAQLCEFPMICQLNE